MCQVKSCMSPFTITFRRHHCRACGLVVCSNCSSNKAALKYLKYRAARVCDPCYDKLKTTQDEQRNSMNVSSGEVTGNDAGSTLSGHLYKSDNGKTWKKRWFVIKEKVLYSYKASHDVAATKSIPLLGYEVISCFDPPENDHKLTFHLKHRGQPQLYFRAESTAALERWLKAMQDATVLE
ncbi:FYVE: RhoGEF and PH domain-containing protein 6-like protein [Leptotrombidium deliense]|uniref:FYVE: RhoGEF and PH domain-containing protein 6-like protein n=1 Tax=Leptotrombidium deliense TaxID=299467 RepID=A0A443S9E2_9ACAR|nr:FYVE: RhoGEF and PH domain-containing protein 6-like protein [Leptotrombidium deliense]